MKQFILIPLFFLSSFLWAQMDISSYLNLVKVDFQQPNLIPDSVIQNYDVILIGETHGFHDNYTIAWKLIKEYKQKTDFKYMLAEMDWASAQEINTILNEQDTVALNAYINDLKGSPAWCKERYDFYFNIMKLNQTTNRKIQLIGVDVPSGGIKLALERVQTLRSKYRTNTDTLDAILSQNTLNDSVITLIQNMHLVNMETTYSSKDLFEHNYHIQNISGYWEAANTPTESAWDRVRDSCMFENYKRLEQYYNLTDEKMIGIWGYIHAYQQESERTKWFASRLKNELNKQIYSYRIFYFNSKCMLPASWLPGVLTFYRLKKKSYYNINVQNDDSWVNGKKPGVDELRKVTPRHSIFLYPLNQLNSPYIQQMSLVPGVYHDWVTTDYFQSAIVVRHSPPTIPYGENKN